MKRIFSIALLAVFIFSTVGVIAGSYCCQVGCTATKMKSCCDMTDENCCAQKEVKLLKVNDDFLSAIPQQLVKSYSHFLVLMSINLHQNEDSFLVCSPIYLPDRAPPGKTLARLAFIQSFLI